MKPKNYGKEKKRDDPQGAQEKVNLIIRLGTPEAAHMRDTNEARRLAAGWSSLRAYNTALENGVIEYTKRPDWYMPRRGRPAQTVGALTAAAACRQSPGAPARAFFANDGA